MGEKTFLNLNLRFNALVAVIMSAKTETLYVMKLQENAWVVRLGFGPALWGPYQTREEATDVARIVAKTGPSCEIKIQSGPLDGQMRALPLN